MADWVRVARVDEIPEDGAIEADVADVEVALFRIDGTVYATEASCTHQHARLADGFLDGCEIECPLHQARFDVRTGKVLCAPADRDLRVFPVRVEAGEVFVDASPTTAP